MNPTPVQSFSNLRDGLAAPLTNASVDLKGCPAFMLDADRLLTSDLLALSTDAAFKAAIRLWCWAWKQRPGASLPNDDKILAGYAGVSARFWLTIKPMALRGFVLCSDRRLYHPLLSADANRLGDKRATASKKGALGNSVRWGNGSPKESPSDPPAIAEVVAGGIPNDRPSPSPSPSPSPKERGGESPPALLGVQQGDNPKPKTATDRRREFVASLGGKLKGPNGEDLLSEWIAAFKGFGEQRIKETFAAAQPGILWPSDFKKNRGLIGNY